jgi:hypothetical protein
MWVVYGGFSTGIDEVAEERHGFQEMGSGFLKRHE